MALRTFHKKNKQKIKMASDDNGKTSDDTENKVADPTDEEMASLKETKESVPTTTTSTSDAEATEATSSENSNGMDLSSTAASTLRQILDSLGENPVPAPIPSTSDGTKEMVEFKVIFNKQKHDVVFPLDDTVAVLKLHIQTLTGVPTTMQKVMFKGLAKDDKTLRDLGVTKGVKVMVVGSTLTDVLSVTAPTKEELKEEKGATSSKEPICKQKMHKKIIDKGVPEDAMPGIKNVKDTLPAFPLSGMLNKSGGKVRLTFKLESDQIWIGTKERTDKIPMNSIKTVVNEPIEGHPEYHIMGIQLGPTEASRYWIYWVPAQYVDAIKDAVLGKWQYF